MSKLGIFTLVQVIFLWVLGLLYVLTVNKISGNVAIMEKRISIVEDEIHFFKSYYYDKEQNSTISKMRILTQKYKDPNVSDDEIRDLMKEIESDYPVGWRLIMPERPEKIKAPKCCID